jgi:hypothetical protein
MSSILKSGRVALGIVIATAAVWQAGCSSNTDAGASPNSEFVLREEPQDAVDVLDVRKDATNDEDVVVVGRIGGSTDPWTTGLAAFSIVDRSLTPCNEIEGDKCTTPWDYCCESELPKATVLVKFVDESGKVLKQDAREMLKLEELQTVVVRGKALRDDSGNVTIAATGVHVRNNGIDGNK